MFNKIQFSFLTSLFYHLYLCLLFQPSSILTLFYLNKNYSPHLFCTFIYNYFYSWSYVSIISLILNNQTEYEINANEKDDD